jgi:hypothetical protein
VPGAAATSETEQAQAENLLSDLLDAGQLRHGNQGELDTAVKAARWRNRAATRVLERRGSADITPLRAAALAVFGLRTSGPSGYEDRGMVVL